MLTLKFVTAGNGSLDGNITYVPAPECRIVVQPADGSTNVFAPNRHGVEVSYSVGGEYGFDCLYVINAAGKTIDVIRGRLPDGV